MVAQLVRALACHARGRGFEPHPSRHFSRGITAKVEPHPSRHFSKITYHADLAHLVERHLAKVEVAGSSPVIRSKQSTSLIRSAFYFTVRGSNEFEFHSSRIVVSRRRRKSLARLSPCFISHRSQKQHSVIFASLTRNPLQKSRINRIRLFLSKPQVWYIIECITSALWGWISSLVRVYFPAV